ncbi:enoyl-ACP reductase FabI [Donghicola tyrosinivorans]|uniref:Enoyl-[acyl-carrier-protein] reductase [NADH] n=1 Tax=Donghicola tyrosinivorans TaxID=1652492 RepID=A0A2T0WGP6_9RHOB|nr:enoyl-ACP reductase FabI [Donghicola tyrosinivorans]PRY85835.1 enoyl-[acyl-carrier protein] reductase I [Donghicola tyrosinivorans]
MLQGKKALIVGIANDHSIAYGIAKAMHAAGADLALTSLNAKALPYVQALATELDADILAPLDVENPAEQDALFQEIHKKWGKLDILVHSIAFCPKDDLYGRVVDTSADGVALAMDVSVHSFLRLIKASEPLMCDGGACMTVSYLGADKVVENYNIMGPVKAALQSVTRYAAVELGPKGISVNALSPGPISTRAANGLPEFDSLMKKAQDATPTGRLTTIDETGAFAAFLASDAARNITGGVHMLDGGYSLRS